MNAGPSDPSSAHWAKTVELLGEGRAGWPWAAGGLGQPCHGLPVESPQTRQFRNARRAPLALWSAPGPGAGREEKGRARGCGQLDRQRRRGRRWGRGAPQAMASEEAWGGEMEQRITSETTRG